MLWIGAGPGGMFIPVLLRELNEGECAPAPGDPYGVYRTLEGDEAKGELTGGDPICILPRVRWRVFVGDPIAIGAEAALER